MKWSEFTWEKSINIYEAIIKMSFLDELAKGTLPMDKFLFYLSQDSLYLQHYSRALAHVGIKAHDIQDAGTFYGYASMALVGEGEMQGKYFQKHNFVSDKVLHPACHHYTSFLKGMASFEPVEVGMAATLPCFWIYKRVGEEIAKREKVPNNPYQDWIDMYASEEFAEPTRQAIGICDKVAENTTQAIRDRMTEAYLMASRLEYDFWDGAYTLRKWRF